MKKILLALNILAFLTAFVPHASAQSVKTITLKDGSSIKGEIIKLEDSNYTVKTPSLGVMIVKDADILNISSGSDVPLAANPQAVPLSGALNPNDPQFKNQIQQIQGNVMADPDIMKDIENLVNNEEIKKALSDPKLISDAMSFDPNKIQNNPQLQHLMENPEMKRVMEKVNHKIETEKK